MNAVKSPFKFLDSYQQQDFDIFFGRERETNALYQSLSGVKHLLVYGPSGAGKTSLIECGLRNQFSDADWYALTIRRGANMTASVFARINESLRQKIALQPATGLPTDPETDFGEAVERLFEERYQPVYLLFDQFEELLLLGSEAEKRDFFTRLQALIEYKTPCRVLLVMREEFIGHLSEWEAICPSIFQHRFRLEKMSRSNVQAVVQQILEAEQYQPYFQTQQPEMLAAGILSKLPDTQREIELAHVQVFLDELWHRAAEQPIAGEKPVLQSSLVREDDDLERILDSFLKKQLRELAPAHGDKLPLELLATLITERHTKLQAGLAYMEAAIAKNGVTLAQPLTALLRELEQRRILRALKVGEQTQYEISHDVLARVVGGNLTEEMKLRERAREVYRVYEGRAGLFSREDLDYLRPFEAYLAMPDSIQQRIIESEAAIKHREQTELEATKKRLRTVRGLLTAIGIGLIVALGAMFWAFSAQKETEVAYSNLKTENEKRLAAEADKRFKEFEEEIKLAYGQLSGGNSCLADDTFERLQSAIFELNSEETKNKIQELNIAIRKNSNTCPILKSQK
jgi:hypothetical protein